MMTERDASLMTPPTTTPISSPYYHLHRPRNGPTDSQVQEALSLSQQGEMAFALGRIAMATLSDSPITLYPTEYAA